MKFPLSVPLTGPKDTEAFVRNGSEDAVLTFRQVQRQSMEVTDREYGVTIATTGGTKLMFKAL